MIKLKGIHHIAIICSDYQKSKQFYTEILGLSVINETYREKRNSYKLDLKINDTEQIELFSFPDPPARIGYPEYPQEACGLRHLALEVDDIDSSVSHLQSQGIEVENIRLDELTKKRFTFFKDPDNLPIELYES